MIQRQFWGILIIGLSFFSCKEGIKVNEDANHPEIIFELNKQLTEAILQDGFSPPNASRIYAYPNIAAFEILRLQSPNAKSLGKNLNGFPELPAPKNINSLNLNIAAIEAFVRVAKALVYRDYLMDTVKTNLFLLLDIQKIPEKLIKDSEKYGNEIAENIILWAKEDGYAKTRNKAIFTPKKHPGAWEPTPPTYGEALEPYWFELRSFQFDSANQFSPLPPLPYSENKNSSFYYQAIEAKDVVNTNKAENIVIARFWDDNPFISVNQGHLMFANRQVSPPGHWNLIAISVMKKEKTSLPEAAKILAILSVAIADGTISCWKEKYRSNLIRPETYINRFIDPKWRPILETPKFPEHPSGHSVTSGAASTILAHFFGENYSFTDSTTVPYGSSPRNFPDFRSAAQEASISRLYGGIHYRLAVEEGLKQGIAIGAFTLKKLNSD